MKAQTLKIRNVVFGDGMPVICVPIVAEREPDILEAAEQICEYHPDCLEWRMDYFLQADSPECVLAVLQKLRVVVGDSALLVTFRTKAEGGQREIAAADYRHLYETVCESGLADLIDVEAFMEEGLLSAMCQYAHRHKVYVVASSHDFSGTPEETELLKRLEYMDKEGADLPKLAVMPESERDVLTLLSTTSRYYENGGTKPIITMSMERLGMASRVTGEIFGSAMTFGAVEKSSAPGQLPIEELREILKIIHKHY